MLEITDSAVLDILQTNSAYSDISLTSINIPSLIEIEEGIDEVTTDNLFDVVVAPFRKYVGIVMHHTYSPELPIWERNYGKIINNYHYEINGWQFGLGYQFLVTWDPNKNGAIRVQSSYRWKHQLSGAHTLNRKNFLNGIAPNSSMIGIGICGNFDIHEPPIWLYQEIKQFTDLLQIKLNIPKNNIYRHENFDYKSCPGDKFNIGFLKD
jgi:hypothetical protein